MWKKVSDTAERCIHCGAPTTVSVPAPQATPQQEQAKPPKTEPPKDYNKILDGNRIQLEIDFLQQDPWAEKYRSKGMELKEFRNLFYLASGLLVAFTWIYSIVAFRIMEGWFANTTALLAAGIGKLTLLIVSGVLAKIYSIRLRRYERSSKKLIY